MQTFCQEVGLIQFVFAHKAPLPQQLPMVMQALLKAGITSVDVHGLRHAFGAKQPFFRYVWTFLVFCATTGLLYHLSLLVSQFMEEPISTKMTSDAVDFKFPSFYICSPYLFSNQQHLESLQHANSKENIRIINVIHIRSLKVLQKLRYKRIISSRHYRTLLNEIIISSMNLQNLAFLGLQDKFQTIIKASINGKVLDMTAFQMVSNDRFFSCLKFMNSSFLRTPSDQLILYLYIDVSQKNETFSNALLAVTYSGALVFDKPNGLLLLFKEEGYYPDQSSSYFTVSSGKHSKISISMELREMTSTAGNPCLLYPKSVNVKSHVDININMTYKLDYTLCTSYHWALVFYSYCKCVPLQYPMPANIARKTSRCSNVTYYSVNSVVNALSCVFTTKRNEKIKKSIHDNCVGIDACSRKVYDMRWSAATWPTTQLIDWFVTSELAEIYKRNIVENGPVRAWRNILNASDDVRARLVRENIMKVDISPKTTRSSRIIERKAYPAMNFFSDVGGILGLYLGMSLISFFELFEVLISAAKMQLLSLKRNSIAAVTPSCV